MRGLVFDIQNYCLYDGPGIRTCVYLKGCPLNCPWCHNPESISSHKQMAYWIDRCALCGSCANLCPEHALSLQSDRIVRDQDKCIACGLCQTVCPNNAMEIIGFEITVDELANRIEPDIPFFNKSGGGITLTGGEPTFQTKFILAFCRQLKERNISCALETCGYFNPSLLPELLNTFDLFLFDLKQMDNKKHAQIIGVENQGILENFKAILDQAGSDRIIPRIPLIPGFNTDKASISAFIEFLLDNGYEGSVHLMPFHDWAKDKYTRIGKAYTWNTNTPINQTAQAKIIEPFKAMGFEVVWGG